VLVVHAPTRLRTAPAWQAEGGGYSRWNCARAVERLKDALRMNSFFRSVVVFVFAPAASTIPICARDIDPLQGTVMAKFALDHLRH
jgi:hypothetical protein